MMSPGIGHWPARIAYATAGLFTCASGATNLVYGWSKGTDFASSAIWAAVSLGVSVVFALSWPALIRCADARQWARSIMVLMALLLTGTYSVSAALGSAMGGRSNAAAEERSVGDARAKAQAAYDQAASDLQKLAPSRPALELQALIDAAQGELSGMPQTRTPAQLQALMDGVRTAPQSGDCAAVNGSLRMRCPKLAEWQAEMGRAVQRQKLAASITDLRAEHARAEQRAALKSEADAAADRLGRMGPVRMANSNAVALSVYLSGLGIPVDADRLNKLLVLLAVLVVECGSGLALTVGMSLAIHHTDAPNPHTANPIATSTTPVASGADFVATTTSQTRLLELLASAGGKLIIGQRALAESLGVSKTQVARLIRELSVAGRIAAVSGRSGTVLKLSK